MFETYGLNKLWRGTAQSRCARALGSLLVAVLMGNTAYAAQAAPLNVVASFSILGDMVHQIGGQFISLTTIVGPDGDAHSFEPAPKDARDLAQAQVLFVNGFGFEAWLPRLVKASGFHGTEVVVSEGVTPRPLTAGEQAVEHHNADRGRAQRETPDAAHQHGSIDPHAWQSLDNGMVYARNIAKALAKADPVHAAQYQARATAYIAEMEALDAAVRHDLDAIPMDRRKVVTSHDAFGYFGRAYGVRFIAAAGISNDGEPSAKEVAAIIDQIKKDHIPAVFIENITSPKLMKQIAHETGAKVGGTLYSDALAKLGQPAGTYLGMFKWNAGQLISALRAGVIKAR